MLMADEETPKSMHFEEQVDLDKLEPQPESTSRAVQFRRPTVDFVALQFTGNNFDEIREHVGTRQIPTDEAFDIDANRPYVIQNFNPIGTYLIPSDLNAGAEGELWIESDRVWRPVHVGEWIVQQDEGWLTVTTEWLEINCIQLDAEMLALIHEMERPKTFQENLTALLNHHSKENVSGTPDFILAQYLSESLRNFETATTLRANWRGESVELPALQNLRAESGHFTDDLSQGGLEAGDTQSLDVSVDLGKWEPQDEVGKKVPLIMYEGGLKNEIGTATIEVTPGEVRVTGTINAVVPIFQETDLHPQQTALDVPKDEPIEEPQPTGRFARYQQKGLTDNDK
jgi:hypothetical protein